MMDMGAEGVIEAIERALHLAVEQGADLTMASEVLLSFAEDGAITVTVDAEDYAIAADSMTQEMP